MPGLFDSFGGIPELLMGKKPKDSLWDVAQTAGMAALTGLPVGAVPDGSSFVDLTGSPLESLVNTPQPPPQAPGLMNMMKEASPMLSSVSSGLQIGKSLMPAPVEHAPVAQPGTGPQALAGLFASLEQKQQADLQRADQERLRRRMGGY